MEYEIEGTRYSLGEFYKTYKEKLPTIVMVTQGFCGEILAETLDYGLVIRIHSICRQPRVIATRKNDHGTEEYSFPRDYPLTFCFDEGLYQNEGQTLAEILDQRKLPVNVQFAKKQFIKVDDVTSSTSHFSTLCLTNVFDEIYLLGNLVSGDELDQQIIQIPLYLSEVRFSEVIGLKQKNKSDWESLKNKLNYAATQMDFTSCSGNPEIAKYKSNNLSKLVFEGHVDQDLYQNCEPQTYTNAEAIIANATSSGPGTADNDDLSLYEPIEPSSSKNKNVTKSGQKPLADDSKDQDQFNKPQSSLVKELKIIFNKDSKPIEKRTKPPKLGPKPKRDSITPGHIWQGQRSESNLPGETFGDPPPPIPPRLPSRASSEVGSMKTNPPHDEESYVNLKHRAHVHPMPNLQPSSTTSNEVITFGDGLTEVKSSNLQQEKDQENAGTLNVEVLKVDELGRWMAEKLNLGKYVTRFAEELMDGAMLIELDENILKQEFGFSLIEAKRLIKFAKEGHVPK